MSRCGLAAVGMHEQARIRSAAFAGVVNNLTAQQSEQEHHEEVRTSAASERGVWWPDERDDGAPGLQNPNRFLDRIAPDSAEHARERRLVGPAGLEPATRPL